MPPKSFIFPGKQQGDEVEVLAGAVVRDGLFEPAFEFVLKATWARGGSAEADLGYRFSLRGYFD